jgi:hypothetical protein
MTNPITQALFCEGCDKPIAVDFQPADFGDAKQNPKEQPWVCPHGCGWTERPRLLGTIKEVRVRTSDA